MNTYVRYSLILLGTAAIIAGASCIENLTQGLSICLWSNIKVSVFKLIQAIAVGFFLFWGAQKVIEWIKDQLQEVKLHPSNRVLIINTISILIYILGFLFILNLLGINLTTIGFLSGGLVLGIGFGIQKIASNFISGIIILFEKSIEVGDMLQIDDSTRGFLKNTGAIYTLIQAVDGRKILIPNESFITNRVVSLTHKEKKGRLNINVGVSYDSDIHQVKKILIDCASRHEMVVNPEKINCCLTQFGDSSIDFVLMFWIKDITKGALSTKSEIMFDIWDQFKKNNITIPFPQRDIHVQEKETLG